YSYFDQWLLFILLCAIVTPLPAQEAGESVRLQGVITEDVYAAGGMVDVLATVEGDVVVAGGRIAIGETVSGDVMAAGGSVEVHAAVGDDVRLAGGDVRLSGTVEDDAIAAGGNVMLSPDSKVGGRAWLSGGRIEVAGLVGRELRAVGGEVVLSGRVNGDVKLDARKIRILDTAVIDGDLSYAGPQEAEIAEGAQIHGSIDYEPVERPMGPLIAAAVGMVFLVLLSLILTGILWYLLFPRFIAGAVTNIRAEPWKCLGLGLALFAATPVVISMLFVTLIGWLPALVTGGLYLLLILSGFLTSAFFVGDRIWGLRGRSEVSRAGRLGSFAIAAFLIILLGLIPLLGNLLLFVLMLLGVGTVTLGLYRAYEGDASAGLV
ncbi:MAG: polymer-forming cytoskeletal protein, partial [Chromatiales bacterium]